MEEAEPFKLKPQKPMKRRTLKCKAEAPKLRALSTNPGLQTGTPQLYAKMLTGKPKSTHWSETIKQYSRKSLKSKRQDVCIQH